MIWLECLKFISMINFISKSHWLYFLHFQTRVIENEIVGCKLRGN